MCNTVIYYIVCTTYVAINTAIYKVTCTSFNPINRLSPIIGIQLTGEKNYAGTQH